MGITRGQAATDCLTSVNKAPNPENLIAMLAWAESEYAATVPPHRQALNNPYDSERVMDEGETNFNPEGVKNYPSWAVGLQAWKDTIENGKYQAILDAMDANNADVLVEAIHNSLWGSKPTDQQVATIRANFNWYANLLINSGDTEVKETSVEIPTPGPITDPTGKELSAPIVAALGTPSGNGYWVVGADGAVYAYGDAEYYGGANDEKLNAPIVAIVTNKTGAGYGLIASDGGTFAYGNFTFRGAV